MEAVLSRREKERLTRRNAMLEAARAVFAEKGYAQATLEEVAQRAEFGKGTLYNYFANKEELLFAILDDLYDEWCAFTRHTFEVAAQENLPIREAFYRYIDTCLTHFLGRQDLFQILTKEVHRMLFEHSTEQVTYLVAQRERVIELLIPAIESAVQRGELKPLPAHAVAHMILGTINGFLMYACLHDCGRQEAISPPTDQAATDFLVTVLFDGLSSTSDSACFTPEPA